VSVRYGTPLTNLESLSKALNLFELVVRVRLGKMMAQRYEKKLNFTIFKKKHLVSSKNCCNFVENCDFMKTPKKYFEELQPDDANMLCEPEVAYTYESKKDCESILIGKFDPIPTELPKKDFHQAVAECNAITVDAFIDELNYRIKKRFANV
jgi:hypothetical protein